MELIAVATPSDEADWLTVHNEAVAARQWSPAGVRDLITRSSAHRQIVVHLGGAPAGAALAVRGAGRATIWISVLPTCRRQAVGSALWRDVADWVAGGGGGLIETRVEAADAASIAFAQARGLTVARVESRLVHDLSTRASSHAVPGLRVVQLRAESGLIDGAYAVFAQREPPAGPITPHAWHEQMLAEETGGTQRTTVAVLEGRVVGYAVLALLAARPDVAAHNGTFVDPEFKRLGVASVLKAEQVDWARAAGYRRLEASADPENVAKMRLYANLGYREVPGWCLMRTT